MMKGFEENVVLTNANTQYKFVLPKYTKNWTMKVRGGETVYWARESGKVAPATETGAPTAPYNTIADGSIPFTPPIDTHETIYLASPSAGAVVEIWGYKDAQR